MGRTFIRQAAQIYSSDVYTDSLTAGSTLESSAATVEDDLNGLRSQIKRLSGDANWYAALSGRNLATVSTDLADIEAKKLLFRAQVLTDVAVGASANFAVLSVASSETPTEVIALGASVTSGAVTAALPGASGTHSLLEVAGVNAISPKNLCVVRLASTGQPIQSGGKDVFALLQVESAATNGDAFDDTTKQAQLSFVIENSSGDDLIACPAVDIQGKTINYSYVRRINLDAVPESAFLAGVFVDQTASVDVTLDNAIDNQSGPATQTQNIEVRITDTFSWKFEDSTGGSALVSVAPASGNDVVQFNVDTFDVNNTARADFLNGVRFDSGGTAIDLGDTAGTLASAGKLDVTTASTFNLSLLAGGEIAFSDTNKGGSTFAGSLLLSDTSAEWDNYETAFGEVSLLNAIYQAANSASHLKTVAVVTTNTVANTNMTGAGGSPNLDAQLGDYSGVTFVSDVDVFLNGVLLRNGADASANNDVYPGTTAADGDLKFEFALKGGAKPDVLTMIIYG